MLSCIVCVLMGFIVAVSFSPGAQRIDFSSSTTCMNAFYFIFLFFCSPLRKQRDYFIADPQKPSWGSGLISTIRRQTHSPEDQKVNIQHLSEVVLSAELSFLLGLIRFPFDAFLISRLCSLQTGTALVL